MISPTEKINKKSIGIDALSTLEILSIMNREDKKIFRAVQKILPTIAMLIDDIVSKFTDGGRIIYVGAGTSGRLGVLDASECPPTFSTEPWQVVGIIAGGDVALRNSIEGAEDNQHQGAEDLASLHITSQDVVIGIAASGNTPYVFGALQYAQSKSVTTAAISSNDHAKIFSVADYALFTDSGPELIAGSTRLKAGTSQKLVLNMISTATMIKLGKVYGNLMVDVQPTNNKLIARAKYLIECVLECGKEEAEHLFSASGNSVKKAIIMGSLGVSREESEKLLTAHRGFLSSIIASDA